MLFQHQDHSAAICNGPLGVLFGLDLSLLVLTHQNDECGSSTGKRQNQRDGYHTLCFRRTLRQRAIFFLTHRSYLNMCKKARLLLDMDTAGIYLACYIFRSSISPRLCSPLSLHHKNQDPIPAPLAGSGYRQWSRKENKGWVSCEKRHQMPLKRHSTANLASLQIGKGHLQRDPGNQSLFVPPLIQAPPLPLSVAKSLCPSPVSPTVAKFRSACCTKKSWAWAEGRQGSVDFNQGTHPSLLLSHCRVTVSAWLHLSTRMQYIRVLMLSVGAVFHVHTGWWLRWSALQL